MNKVTRFFYDTEFHEDGNTIDLLSFGMVCEDSDSELYRVNLDADWKRAWRNDWLRVNVLGSIKHQLHLPHRFDDSKMSVQITEKWPIQATKQEIARELVKFVETNLPPEHTPEFWAYYGAYDHVAMAQLFGRMIDLPAFFPMFTMDIKQLAVMKGNPTLPEQDESTQHNALDDARHNKAMYQFLISNDFRMDERYI